MNDETLKNKTFAHIDIIISTSLTPDIVRIFSIYGGKQMKLVSGVLKGNPEYEKNKKGFYYLRAVEDMVKLIDHVSEEKNFGYMNRNYALAQLITALEVYLKERIIIELKTNHNKIKIFIREYDFGSQISKEDLIDGMDNFVFNKHLDNIVFHNIVTVSRIYEIVFNISLVKLKQKEDIFKLINLRHRIIHHMSVDKSGNDIQTTMSDLLKNARIVKNFINNIEYNIKHPGEQMRKYPTVSHPLYNNIRSFDRNIKKASGKR